MPILLKRLSCEQLLVIKKGGKHLHLRDHSSSTLAWSYLLIKPFGHSISFLSSFLKMVAGMQRLVKERKSNEENEVREMKYTLRIKGLGRVHIFNGV